MTKVGGIRIDVAINLVNTIASQSYAQKNKVGSIIVKSGRIISTGYNGTPSGFNNACEHDVKISGIPTLVTKQEVIHSEVNAIAFAAKHGTRLKGSTLICSLSPCIECAKIIAQSGIRKVYYIDDYRDQAGITLLTQLEIKCEKI